MNAFIGFLAQSTIILSAMYVVYRLIFHHLTLFSFNRLFLWMIMIISVLIPFLPSVPLLKETLPAGVAAAYQQILIPTESINTDAVYSTINTVSSEWSLAIYFLIGYFLIAGLLVIYFLWDIIRLLISSNNQLWYSDGKYKLFKMSRYPGAFSFFNRIYINSSGLNEDDLELIIKHEKNHIHRYHSIDLVVMQVFILFQWFNPFIWMMKKSMQEIHEYQADQDIINQNELKADYSNLLLRFAENYLLTKTLNTFNSLIYNRMKMMFKPASSRWNLLHLAWIIPLLAGVSMLLQSANSFSNPESSYTMDTLPTEIPLTDTYTVVLDVQDTSGLVIKEEEDKITIHLSGEDKVSVTMDGENVEVPGLRNHQPDKKMKVKLDVLPIARETLTRTMIAYNNHPHPLDYKLTWSKGVYYFSDNQANALAIQDGSVYLIGESTAYGHFVILEHSDHTFTLYGNLEEISVKPAQKLVKHDIIGIGTFSAEHKTWMVYLERIENEETFIELE